MNFSDINNLELKDIVSAPAPVRAIVMLVVLVVILVAGWFLVWSDSMEALKKARAEEQVLRESYTVKKGQAFHYEAYKRRLAEIEQSLASMLKQLPDRSEMDALLTDINQVGVGRGLEFELFRPGAEVPADFYATVPVAVKVTGSYHDIAGFISDLAKLPRIVTVHDMAMVPIPNNSKDNKEVTDTNLRLEARVETYRYLDEGELAAKKKQKTGGQKK